MLQLAINPVFKYAIWAIPVTILVIAPPFTDPINLPKLLALVSITFATAVLFGALRSFSTKRYSSHTSKMGQSIYTLLTLAILISGSLGSDNFTRILWGASGRNNGLIYYLSVLVLALILINLTVGFSEVAYLERIIAGTSLVFAAYCLLQFLALDPVAWANPFNRVIGTLGNPNFSASALATFAVFWLYRFFRTSSSEIGTRVIFLFFSLVMVLLSWATESIQGILIFAIGSFLVLYMWVRERYDSRLLSSGLLLSGVTVLILVFTSFLGLGPLGDILEQYTLKLRGWYAFFGFIGMINSPWTGVGVDNYIDAFRMYKTGNFVNQYGSGLSSNNAHSTPVQMGASFGIIVFALYVILQLLILYRALQIVSSKEDSRIYFKGLCLVWILIFAQSLLSIEIIGLGVMNWIIGAIILVAHFDDEETYKKPTFKDKNKQKSNLQVFPDWTGALTIVAVLLGSIPTLWVAKEDQAYQRIAYGQIIDNAGKELVRVEYGNLNGLTFSYPDKVDKIVSNMFQAGLESETERVVKNLYAMESKNAFAADLLATYYMNTGQTNLEVKIRERIRVLDPWNEKLELDLAKAYFVLGEISSLRDSVERLKRIAKDSAEYQEALLLLQGQHAVP